MKSYFNEKDGLNIEFEHKNEEEHFARAVGYILESMGDEIEDFIDEQVTVERHSLDRAIDLDKEIEKVTFSDPATVVFWRDGEKTVSKAKNGDKFSKETGLAMAILRRLCGNRNYNKVFEKYCNNK